MYNLDNSRELSNSDPIPYDSQTNPCTNISSDNLDRTRSCDKTQSCDIQYASSISSSTNISYDSLDNCSDTLYNMPSDSNNIQSGKHLSTGITRNPPSLSKEAWSDIDTELKHVNQELWDRFRNKKRRTGQIHCRS